MPGVPTFSAAELSAEQIDQYDHNPSPDAAAKYFRLTVTSCIEPNYHLVVCIEVALVAER